MFLPQISFPLLLLFVLHGKRLAELSAISFHAVIGNGVERIERQAAMHVQEDAPQGIETMLDAVAPFGLDAKIVSDVFVLSE